MKSTTPINPTIILLCSLCMSPWLACYFNLFFKPKSLHVISHLKNNIYTLKSVRRRNLSTTTFLVFQRKFVQHDFQNRLPYLKPSHIDDFRFTRNFALMIYALYDCCSDEELHQYFVKTFFGYELAWETTRTAAMQQLSVLSETCPKLLLRQQTKVSSS